MHNYFGGNNYVDLNKGHLALLDDTEDADFIVCRPNSNHVQHRSGHTSQTVGASHNDNVSDEIWVTLNSRHSRPLVTDTVSL